MNTEILSTVTNSENASSQEGQYEDHTAMPVRAILAVAADMLDGVTYDQHHGDLMLRAIASLHYAHELDKHQQGPLYRLVESKFDEIDKAILEITFQSGFTSLTS